MPHENKETTSEKANFSSKTFSQSTSKPEQKIYVAKPVALIK